MTKTPPPQKTAAEAAALQREKDDLAQQVKRLVKAESQLYRYQEELDTQLKEYKDLYDLNKRLNATFDICDIFGYAVRYGIENLQYERCIIFHRRDTDSHFHVCALDGYYDEAERAEVARYTITGDAPLLIRMLQRESLVCGADCREEELDRVRPKLLMDEYFIYSLCPHVHPHALLAIGNTNRNAEFYRRVGDNPGALLSIGNFVGVISSSMENRFLYNKMEKALQQQKAAQKALRESEQKYRQLSEALEIRVKEAVDELRQKDRILIIQGRQAVMGEMISNIAHQWRQPLNILGLLAQNLQIAQEMGLITGELVEENARKTMEVIQHMSRTIDDFRYFFNPDKEKVRFHVLETIRKVLSLLQGSFASYGIRTSLTETDNPVIEGYPGEFSQALLNILINARDALTARKIPDPFIGITLFTKGDRSVVTIADNAGGIPEEIIDRVFEPYFTTKGPEQGTGIGLFMCKTIIEKNMQGTLTVRNVGQGAEFRIELQSGR